MAIFPNRTLWRRCLIVLGLALVIAGCGPADEAPDAASPPVEGQTAPAEARTPSLPTPTRQSDSGPEPSPPAPPADLLIVDLAELDSYRAHTVLSPVDAEESGLAGLPFLGSATVMDSEYVRQPPASRTVIRDKSGAILTELITVQDQSWINVGQMGWMATGPEEEDASAGVAPEVEEMVRQIQQDLVWIGRETVDGRQALRYGVDGEYEVPFPGTGQEEVAGDPDLPIPMAVRGTVVGHIWVLDEPGLPAVIVRAVTTQEIGFVYAEKPELGSQLPPGIALLFGDGTLTVRQEREVTDINQPILIEAPDTALDMRSLIPYPTPAPGAEPPTANRPLGQDAGERLDLVALDSLDSYQATLTTRIRTGENTISTTLTEWWVADPPARRLQAALGTGEMSLEYVVTEGRAWLKVGETWAEADSGDIDDLRGDLADFTGPMENMVFVGSASIDGIATRQYRKEESVAGQEAVTEVWVADQADLPAVVVQARYTLELAAITTVNELVVSQINRPITIPVPR